MNVVSVVVMGQPVLRQMNLPLTNPYNRHFIFSLLPPLVVKDYLETTGLVLLEMGIAVIL